MRIEDVRRSLTALTAGLLVAACTGVDRDGSTEAASGLSAQQFADIPVPDGMILQTGLNESHSFESGHLRHGDLDHYGSLPVEAVADYLRERMPLNGWRLVEESTDGGTTELRFARAPNEASCSVWVDSSAVTRMHVAVRTPAG